MMEQHGIGAYQDGIIDLIEDYINDDGYGSDKEKSLPIHYVYAEPLVRPETEYNDSTKKKNKRGELSADEQIAAYDKRHNAMYPNERLKKVSEKNAHLQEWFHYDGNMDRPRTTLEKQREDEYSLPMYRMNQFSFPDDNYKNIGSYGVEHGKNYDHKLSLAEMAKLSSSASSPRSTATSMSGSSKPRDHSRKKTMKSVEEQSQPELNSVTPTKLELIRMLTDTKDHTIEGVRASSMMGTSHIRSSSIRR